MIKRSTLIFAIFSFVFLSFQFSPAARRYTESTFLSLFSAPRVIVSLFHNNAIHTEEYQSLVLENQSLRAQLLEMNNDPARVSEDEADYIWARVYSEYPFNNNDALLVDAGFLDGVFEEFSAFVEPGLYIGTVSRSDSGRSEIRTIFDPGWEIPVFIGENEIDALLVGGHQPVLTLIDKDAKAASGDVVYLAGKDFPFGATVGTIDGIESDSNDRFERAYLTVPYARNDIHAVYLR